MHQVGCLFISDTIAHPALLQAVAAGTDVTGYIWPAGCPWRATSAGDFAEGPRSPPPALTRCGRPFMLVNDLILTDDTPGDAASRPVVLDRSRTADAERMNHLIGSGQVRSLHDAIDRQIHELLCARARRADLPPEELAAGRARLLDGADPAQYGRWIWYPWSARL